MRDLRLANLRKINKYLVASEVLTDTLAKQGYDTKVFTTNVYRKIRSAKKNRTCFGLLPSGSYGRRQERWTCHWSLYRTLQTWLQDPDYLYGGSEERLAELQNQYDLPPTIHFKGIVNEVPYHLHQCYLSASYTELFANACVEALSQGLLALLSDVEIAHRFYADQSNAINLFKSKSELIQR